MELSKRPVKFGRQEDLEPLQLERLARHYDENNSALEERISELEHTLAALEARIEALET